MNRLDLYVGNGNRPHQYRVKLFLPSELSTVVKLENERIDTLTKRVSLPNLELQQVSMYIHGREYKIPFAMTHSDTVSLSFYVDETFFIRRILEFWMLSIDAYRVHSSSGQSDDSFIAELVPSQGIVSAIVDKGRQVVDSVINVAVNKATKFVGGLFDSIGLSETGRNLANYAEGLVKQKIKVHGELHVSPLTYSGEEICTYVYYNVIPVNISNMDYGNDLTGSIQEFTGTFYFTHYTIQQRKPNFADSLINGLISDVGRVTGISGSLNSIQNTIEGWMK